METGMGKGPSNTREDHKEIKSKSCKLKKVEGSWENENTDS